jgi:2-keto-4-pentenoate hydratase/2-oxohepta-3-ene-1,7-dioic acid hydratase in catechol pathway
MKLFRFGDAGHERPGVELADGTRLDVSDLISDFGPAFFEAGGMERLKTVANARTCPAIKGSPRIGPPVARPNQFIAIGLNYRKHAEEMGAKIPTEPEIFVKLTSSICGPNDDILIPPGSQKMDYEVELGFVMKNKLRYLASKEEAMQHVAGFFICNDVSERDYQHRGSQWIKGKSHQNFGPLGPWMVPTEELPDVHNLDLSTKVNGQVRQSSNTNDLIFNIPHIVWYMSQFFTLEPGDVVVTGTPSGVAGGMKPPGWLKAGDTVELNISKLGTQRNTVRQVEVRR